MMTATHTATSQNTAASAFAPIQIDLLDALERRADDIARRKTAEEAAASRGKRRQHLGWRSIFTRQGCQIFSLRG